MDTVDLLVGIFPRGSRNLRIMCFWTRTSHTQSPGAIHTGGGEHRATPLFASAYFFPMSPWEVCICPSSSVQFTHCLSATAQMFPPANSSPKVRLNCICSAPCLWLTQPIFCFLCDLLSPFPLLPCSWEHWAQLCLSLLGCFHFTYWSHSHLPALPDSHSRNKHTLPYPTGWVRCL